MPIKGFESLYYHADTRRRRVTVAVAGGEDASVLEALRQARDRGWILPLLMGRQEKIRETALRCGVDLEGLSIVDTDQPATSAVRAIHSGDAHFLMKGQVATPALMRAVLEPDNGLRTGRTICQVVLIEILTPGRTFLMADTGICVQPTLDQKKEILLGAVDVARALGEPTPRVAIMAASETVSDAMPETHHAAEIQRCAQEGELTGCVVQGPLSFDLAYAGDAGAKKRLGGPVIGAADVMIFPNLVAANLTVKAIMYTAACQFGGVLCGTACPVVFMSRADSTVTRLNSLALALNVVAE